MKVKLNDPATDCLMIAFNGSLVGFVTEADDVEGYIIQATAGPDIDFLRNLKEESPIQYVKKEGKVAFLGDSEKDTKETLLANFNKHRADCGLPPYETNV